MGIAYSPPQQLSNSSLKEVAWNKLEPPDVTVSQTRNTPARAEL
jgi:hypothetical protein